MAILSLPSFMLFCTLYSSRPNKLLYSTNLILGNSPYSTEQFAVQRNEHILTKIVQNKLFLQKCGIDTVIMTNSCYFFRKIRDMRPNNDARVDLNRRMIVLTGTRCTYFEFKTTHKTFCMVIYAAIHCYISYKLAYNSLTT